MLVGLVNFVVVRVRTYSQDWVQSVKQEEETVNMFVEFGANVHAQTCGFTPLHYAEQCGHVEAVFKFLSKVSDRK